VLKYPLRAVSFYGFFVAKTVKRISLPTMPETSVDPNDTVRDWHRQTIDFLNAVARAMQVLQVTRETCK
jgi:hypothetical protein